MKQRMRKKLKTKERNQRIEELIAYYNSFPSWYWKHGLHDAHILDITESGFYVDKKRGKAYRNRLIFAVDSSNAIYENDIKEIIFSNYEIKTPEICIMDIEKPWWMGDKIERLKNGNYLLELTIEAASGEWLTFILEFEMAEIIRNEYSR